MAVGLAIPPQNSERNMPEEALGFKLARCQISDVRKEASPLTFVI
jgi:hypothetical protein